MTLLPRSLPGEGYLNLSFFWIYMIFNWTIFSYIVFIFQTNWDVHNKIRSWDKFWVEKELENFNFKKARRLQCSLQTQGNSCSVSHWMNLKRNAIASLKMFKEGSINQINSIFSSSCSIHFNPMGGWCAWRWQSHWKIEFVSRKKNISMFGMSMDEHAFDWSLIISLHQPN